MDTGTKTQSKRTLLDTLGSLHPVGLTVDSDISINIKSAFINVNRSLTMRVTSSVTNKPMANTCNYK